MLKSKPAVSLKEGWHSAAPAVTKASLTVCRHNHCSSGVTSADAHVLYDGLVAMTAGQHVCSAPLFSLEHQVCGGAGVLNTQISEVVLMICTLLTIASV